MSSLRQRLAQIKKTTKKKKQKTNVNGKIILHVNWNNVQFCKLLKLRTVLCEIRTYFSLFRQLLESNIWFLKTSWLLGLGINLPFNVELSADKTK